MKDYLIQRNGYWYRDNKRGYTDSIFEAGLYEKVDAEREAAIEPDCMAAVPVAKFRAQIESMRARLSAIEAVI